MFWHLMFYQVSSGNLSAAFHVIISFVKHGIEVEKDNNNVDRANTSCFYLLNFVKHLYHYKQHY